MKTGRDIIAEIAATLPGSAGVYRMINAGGESLYVGKAKNLKKRVLQYTNPSLQSLRIAKMVAETKSLDIVITASETEALLLEASLIKYHKPRYNILLRDDKSFPYILLSQKTASTRLCKHRGRHSEKGIYFGPFASTDAVNQTINILQRAFLLRSCSDNIFNNRKRPCLLYQIKRCSAPCVGLISTDEYAAATRLACDFMNGKNNEVKQELAGQMEAAAYVLDYEKAARLRDQIKAITTVQAHLGINHHNIIAADVIAIYRENTQSCVQMFFIRGGQNWGNCHYFLEHDSQIDVAEIRESFITQFYHDHLLPPLILLDEAVVNHELLEIALSQKIASKVRIKVVKRGAKREIIDHLIINARETWHRHINQTKQHGQLIAELGMIIGSKAPLTRIEVYDNSHIMGTNAVGVMIVAGVDGFIKNAYRRFNINPATLSAGDDFAMMEQVLSRRLRAISSDDFPGLMIIDGGLGQLNAVDKALASHTALLSASGVKNADITEGKLPIRLAIAKGAGRNASMEHFYISDETRVAMPLEIKRGSPVFFLLQRLRDEAHRFAIGTHRIKRSNSATLSTLDSIDGIGPARKRSLLRHFGSIKAIINAALIDLEKTPNISKTLAKKIYDHFHTSD